MFSVSARSTAYIRPATLQTDQVTAFLSKRQSAEEASDLAAAYGRFLVENGGSEAGEIPDTPGSKIYKVYDTYELVLHRGKFFAGTHEADNLKSATDVASRIYRKLDVTEK